MSSHPLQKQRRTSGSTLQRRLPRCVLCLRPVLSTAALGYSWQQISSLQIPLSSLPAVIQPVEREDLGIAPLWRLSETAGLGLFLLLGAGLRDAVFPVASERAAEQEADRTGKPGSYIRQITDVLCQRAGG